MITKMITPDKAYKAMKTLYRFCKQNRGCSYNCPFFEETHVNCCLLMGENNPMMWDRKSMKYNLDEWRKHG